EHKAESPAGQGLAAMRRNETGILLFEQRSDPPPIAPTAPKFSRRRNHPARVSGFAVDLGPPPAHADEQESPVMEELRRLSFKSMTDELQQPSEHEQRERPPPQAVTDESGCEHGHRDQ